MKDMKPIKGSLITCAVIAPAVFNRSSQSGIK